MARWGAAALICVALGCTRELDLPAQASPDGYISGRAVDAVQGGALPQAQVSVPGTNLTAATDGQGAFALGPVPAGTYQLLLAERRDGKLLTRLLSGIEVKRGATTALGDLPLRQAALVEGHVLVEGRARGNAGVLVFAPGLPSTAATADDGSYLLRELPEGTVQVQAFRAGYELGTTGDMDLRGGVLTTALDMTLAKAPSDAAPGSIEGTVQVFGRTDASGTAVTALAAGGATASATTSATGAFTLPALVSDLWRVRVALDGFAPVELENLPVAPALVTRAGTILMLPPSTAPFPDGGSVFEQPDAGPPDAGPGEDAGTPDAGSVGAECNFDTDCASGRLCLGGVCSACSSDAQCRSGYVCRGLDCVRSCAANSECAAGQVCSNQSCGPCVANGDCQDPALVCAGGACRHCRNRADCPSGRACMAAGCGDCTADADCGGAGNLCVSGQCISGNCRLDADCGPELICAGNNCAGCGKDSDCAQGRLCLSNRCQLANCRTSADCPQSNPVCTSGLCGPCGADGECLASGVICLQGGCAPGDCHLDSDCSGGKVCDANYCTACTATARCGQDRVCDHGACKPGDCVTSADCTQGQVCLTNGCASCSNDQQCGSGKVCLATGACVVGDCRDGTMCAGTKPVCASNTCTPCNYAAGGSGGCANGRVCAADGSCPLGNCTRPADCTGGQVCVSFACVACDADPAQCPQGSICASGACTPGDCNGDDDCSATQTCTSHHCGGQCRTTAQCAGGAVCDSGTHACRACAASAECSASGVVCGPAGACIPGECAADVPCSDGAPCLLGVCQRSSPSVAASATPTAWPADYGSNTPVYDGASLYLSPGRLYVSGEFLALDPATLQTRFPARAVSWASPGPGATLIPAQGFPGGQMYLAPNLFGYDHLYGLSTLDGTTQLDFAPGAYALPALGVVSGRVTAAWNNDDSYLHAVRPDGTSPSFSGLNVCPGNYSSTGPVFGTQLIYMLCYSTLAAADPEAATLAWSLPHTDLNGTVAGFGYMGAPAVWRPPGATADVVIYPGVIGATNILYAARVTDGSGPNWPGPTQLWKRAIAHFNNTAGVLLDSQGAALTFDTSGGFSMVSQDGTVVDGAGTGFDSPWVVLLDSSSQGGVVQDTVLGFSAGKLAARALLPGDSTAHVKWDLAAPAGTFYSGAPVGVGPDGSLFVWQMANGPSGPFTPLLYKFQQPVAPPAPPAWPVPGGNLARQRRAPSYQCTGDGDCTAPQSCVLGRCIGQCRSASDCGATLGCTLNSCGTCLSDTGCRSGETCSRGACWACTAGSCCHADSDCGNGQTCQRGSCAAQPSFSDSGTWQVPNQSTAYFQFSQGTDGTAYYYVGLNGDVILHAFDPSTGAEYGGNWPALIEHQDPFYQPISPMVVRLPGDSADTLLWPRSVLVHVSGGPTGGVVSTTSVINTPVTPMSYGASRGAPAVFYGHYGGRLVAYDARTGALLWQSLVNCSFSGAPPMVGSDGTVYFLCADGTLQAYDPDGDAQSGLGRMLPGPWPTQSQGWTYIQGEISLRRNAAGPGDIISVVVYRNNDWVLAQIPVSAAGMGTTVYSPALGGPLWGQLRHDALGRTLVVGSKWIQLVGKDGAILSSIFEDPVAWDATLGDDGALYFSGAGKLGALQLTAGGQLSISWQALGPGGYSFDGGSPGLLTGGGRLFSHLFTNNYPLRNFVSLQLPGVGGPASTWSASGGTLQRTFSLKLP